MRASASIVDKRFFWGSALLFLLCLAIALFRGEVLWLGIPFATLLVPLSLLDLRSVFYLQIATIPISFGLDISMDFPDEFLMLFFTFIVILFWTRNYYTIQHLAIGRNPLFVIVALSMVWLLVACICSQQPELSFKFLLKKIWYLIPFFIFPLLFFQKKENIVRTAQFLLLPLFTVTVICLIRQAAVGFRFEEIYDPIQPFFLNHVMYGSMVSVVLPLAIGALWLSRRWSIQWTFSLLMIAVFTFATYFAYSRAAWVAVIFAAVTFLAIRLKWMHHLMTLFYVGVALLVFWLASNNTFLSYKPVHDKTVMHETLEEHIMATLQGTDISSAERYYRWIAALRMSSDYPLTGVGPNNFYDYYKPYTVKSFRTWVSRNPERSTTHNYFIFLLVEQGILAMLLYGLLYWCLFYYGQRYYHQLIDPRSKIILLTALCALAAIFINNFFSELLETDKIGSLFYLSMAVVIMFGVQLDQQSKKRST